MTGRPAHPPPTPTPGPRPAGAAPARHEIPRPGDRGVWNCTEAVNLGETTFFSYAMNMRLSTWLAPDPDRIDRVGPTATMVFMADAPAGFCSVLPAAAPYSPVARHRGRVNVSFLDGHVTSYAGNEVGCGA